MKISVYKLPDGTMDVLVEATVGSGKPPVLAKGITEANVVGVVLPLVEAQRGRRQVVRLELG